MMFSADNSVLLVIDVQEKLAKHMSEKDSLYKNIQSLIHAAQYLEIPILTTEQVPDKIGKTIPEIVGLLKDSPVIEKSSFSCCGQELFVQELEALNKRQIIISGIEAHICVYQTVSDLISLGYEVQVVEDAISSRTIQNKKLAIKRINSMGAKLTSTEMILCELLKTAEHEKFRDVLKLIK